MNIRAPYLGHIKNEHIASIVLPIDDRQSVSFPRAVSWKNVRLDIKDEFHVTLLNVGTASALSQRPREDIVSFFNAYAARRPIALVSFADDFRYVEKDVRKTILVRCVVSNLNLLFEELNRTFEIDMPMQPAHVTLYTLQKNVGIHVPSIEVMERLERVYLPVLEEALPRAVA